MLTEVESLIVLNTEILTSNVNYIVEQKLINYEITFLNHKETKEYRQLMWNNTHQTAPLGDCIVSAGQWKSLLSEQQTHTLAWWPCSQSPCFQATGISWSSHSPWPYIRSSTNCWSLSSRICKSTWVSLVGKWHIIDSLEKYISSIY